MNHKPLGDIPDEELATLDLVLEGVDLDTKLKVYRILEKTQIEAGDPMFLVLLSLTHARVAIAPIPDDLRGLVDDVKAHLVTLQSLNRRQIEDCLDVAAEINVTAKRLSNQMVQHASSGTSSPVFSFQWAFFGAVSGSVLIFVLQRFL
ncbi:hypothetical protein IQ265_03975 [Nodosilinea sp. LEGE 06152]|uniref:hypothetical protein n=1 Tax=Nodosilinea sp. LEGE 06152 TaxID=2777966 RepID=UPI0018807FBB|nr:hypothetical protein [Nodosilinea sp. LEGE 06152]MBE9155993.1 hypothetical protein [Nodosilinea sp. LEGE 06152]